MKRRLALIYSFFLRLFFGLRYGRRVVFGKGVILSFGFKFRGKGRLVVGDNVNMWTHQEKNVFFTYTDAAVIEIGKGCRLNGVTVQCRKGVFVGEGTMIGSALIMDNDFHSVDYRHRNDLDFIKVGEVRIGKNCWIAGQSVILKGVNVGDRSVVAIRSVVSRDVPADVVVAGNPAQVVKELKKLGGGWVGNCRLSPGMGWFGW